MLLSPAQNSFIKQNSALADDDAVNAVAQGWMYKLGAAVRGLEQNYWKKRWVSLYKKPARLAYAQHPHSASDLMDDMYSYDGYNSPHSEVEDTTNSNKLDISAMAVPPESSIKEIKVQS